MIPLLADVDFEKIADAIGDFDKTRLSISIVDLPFLMLQPVEIRSLCDDGRRVHPAEIPITQEHGFNIVLDPILRERPVNLFTVLIEGEALLFDAPLLELLRNISRKMPRLYMQITDEDEQTGRLSWTTLDEDDDNNPVIAAIQGSQDSNQQLLPRDFILATALRLTRYLAH